MSEENRTPNPGNVIFEWFSKDVKVAVITCLIIVVIYQWYQANDLQESRLKLKDEVIEEVRRGYDRELSEFKKELKDTVLSSKANMDTTLKNVNDYVKSNE